MAFIGKEPQVGAYNMLDALTASATASYSLTLDSTAFVPESANHLLVSLNGVIQKAGSSYTVSGSTLTFSSALTSSDSIDFILALGNVLDIGTPSDATVTNAKTNFVSTSSAAGLQIKGDGTTDGTLQLNCSQNSHGIKLKSPAHSAGASYTLTFPTTDGNNEEFLQTNGSGTLTWASAGGTFVKVGDVQSNSSASTHDLTGIFSDTYDSYFFTLSTFPVNANYELHMQFLDSSNTAITSSYYGVSFGYDQAGNSELHNHPGTSEVRLNNGHSSGRAFQCHGYIKGPTSGITNNKQVQWQAGQHDNVNVYEYQIGSYFHTSATDYTGLRIKSNGTNLTAISLQVYGITDSKNYNG